MSLINLIKDWADLSTTSQWRDSQLRPLPSPYKCEMAFHDVPGMGRPGDVRPDSAHTNQIGPIPSLAFDLKFNIVFSVFFVHGKDMGKTLLHRL